MVVKFSREDLEELYAIYLKLPKRSYTAMKAIWNKAHPDRVITRQRAWRLGSENGFSSRLKADDPHMPVGKIHCNQRLRIVEQVILRDKASATPDFIRAVQGAMMEKIHSEISHIKLDTPEKVEKMLASVEKLIELEHTARGSDIKRRETETSNRRPTNFEAMIPTNTVKLSTV